MGVLKGALIGIGALTKKLHTLKGKDVLERGSYCRESAKFSHYGSSEIAKPFYLLCTGVTYNIPVCVWLQENHPYVPPLVFVRPTSTMAIKASQHVDTNGKVYHPFLHEWNYVC